MSARETDAPADRQIRLLAPSDLDDVVEIRRCEQPDLAVGGRVRLPRAHGPAPSAEARAAAIRSTPAAR